jgi:hypothetical protein
MATTAATLITASFMKIGIDSPTAAQTANALISLNNMLSAWGTEYLVPAVTRESQALTIGQSTYTVGSGGDMDTVRPIAVQNVYLENSDGYSFGVRVFAAEDYNRIGLKTQEGRPENMYFIPSETLSKIIFDKEPDAAYTAYFEFWKNFTEFAATSTEVTLPPEYKEAIIYNLAVSLSEDWDRGIKKTTIVKAETARQKLSTLHAATRAIPLAKFDFATRAYNINTDE